MTGTIRKNHSRPHGSQMCHERVSMRRRVVEFGCDEWVRRPSAGRRRFEHLRRNHHGHKPQPRYRQLRAVVSARKRRDIRHERRANNRRTVEDSLSAEEQMLEDEKCFCGKRDRYNELVSEFYTYIELLESTGEGSHWYMDQRMYVDVQLHWQWLERMRRFYKV